MTQYEFAQLYYYSGEGRGSLYNFHTCDPLKDYIDGGGLPRVLQHLSEDGWLIVCIERHVAYGDNDYDVLVYLQREMMRS